MNNNNGKERNRIISSNIRKYIGDAGITQKELAEAIGISPSTLSDYLNLRSNPSHGVIQRIADYFNIKKSDIDTTYKEEDGIYTIFNQLEKHRQEKVYSYAEQQLEEQNKKHTVVTLGKTAAGAPIEQGNKREKSKSGFQKKSEAKAAAAKMESDLHRGIQINKGDMLFSDYYKQWMETYKLGVYTKSTDNFYLNALKLIEEYFPKQRLKEIARDKYQRFLNDYAENDGNPRSKGTVRKTHTKISAALKDAHANGYIAHNPVHRIQIRGVEGVRESEKYLDEEEAKELLQALLDGLKPNYTSRYMLILQLATGMRISEVMGLQFKDLNLLNNRVDINKSWDYKDTLDFSPTKNKETRNISVDKETMDIMKELYDHQTNKKALDHKQRLFAVNNKIPSVNAINKSLRRACERAGIQVVTSHALRHTHASILLLNDVNLGYISKRLGHKTISVTTDVYSHVLDELEARSEKESADTFYNMYN